MALYPHKLLPLDLASMEPCDRYVEVILSPTESDIERNLASTMSSEYTFLEKQSGSTVEAEHDIASIEDVIVEGVTKEAVLEATGDDVKQLETAEQPKPKSTKPPRATEKRKKQTKKESSKTRQFTELPPTDAFKHDAAEKRRQHSDKSPRTSPKQQHQLLDTPLQQENMRTPSGPSTSHQKSGGTKIQSTKRSDSSGLPTDVDIAELILVNMFQRKVEQEESLYDNPFLEDQGERSTVSTVRDRTSPPQADDAEMDFSFESKADLEPSSMLEKAASLKSVEERPHSSKTIAKVDEPLIVRKEKVTEKTPAKKEPETVEVTLAVEQSKTIKIVHSKKKRENIAPLKKKSESAQHILELIQGAEVATKATYSKPQKETVTPAPTSESKVVESSKKEDQLAKADTPKKTSFAGVLPAKQKTDDVEHDDTVDDETIEFRVTSAEALDEPGPSVGLSKVMGEHTHLGAKEIEELTKGIIHVTPSYRRVLTVIPPKTEGAESGHIQSPEYLASLAQEIPDGERKVSVYLKGDVHSVESATVSYTTETTDPTSKSEETDTTHTEYGEPEDVLFFEESREQPIVHTRIYTKQSGTSVTLPPIAPAVPGVGKPDKHRTTFKKKMPETLQQLLERRKQLPTQTFVRDVNTGDLEQALVLTSANLKPQKEFKIYRDPLLLHTPDSATKCLKASSEDPKQIINHYLHSKGIHQLFQYLTTRLIVDRPEKPLDFLIEIVRVVDKRRQFLLNMYTEYTGGSDKKPFA